MSETTPIDNKPAGDKKLVIAVQMPAVVTLYGDNDAVISVNKVYRSIPNLRGFFAALKDREKIRRVKIDLEVEGKDGKTVIPFFPAPKRPIPNVDASGESMEPAVDDSLEAAEQHIKAKSLPWQQALQRIQAKLFDEMQISGIQGLLCTIVVQGQASLITMMSDCTEVDETALQVLGEAASAHAEKYKDECRNNLKVKFPSDKDKDLILTPEQARAQGIVTLR